MSESLIALMRRLTTGVYVIGVGEGEHCNAFTASSVMPVSFSPVLLALAIGYDHASYAPLRQSGRFTVNVLRREQLALARHFGLVSARERDKLAGISWRPSSEGAPILTDALAFLMCEVQSRTAAGDHELLVARVANGVMLDKAARPMTYADTGNMDGSASLYTERNVSGAAHEQALDR